jgi:hypothetical protein
MNVRRSVTALALAGATAVALGAAVPAVAVTPSPAPSAAIPDGLYGTTDPTYDGVWRQSLALLAQRTVGVTPADRAVAWLAGQQCANGAFAAFRADTAKPCDAKLMVDTNSTAAAVQALAALGGHRAATEKAVSWLKSVQNADGGWGYSPGGASDANSTSVVAGSMAAAGQRPAEVKKAGKSSYDALLKLSIACDKAGGGAFAYQPDKKGGLAANADATAAGVLGVLGQGFVTTAGKAPAPMNGNSCGNSPAPLTPSELARNGSAYLVEAIGDDGRLTSALPGAADQPDYGNTADAVVALAAQGWTAQAKKPLAWLERNSAAWAKQSGPAAYAQLLFAAHAMGADPRHFGGTDLVAQLNATGPTPQTTATGKATRQAAESESKDDSDSGYSVWWIVGVFLVAGIGIGFLISGRGSKQQP